jgi:hypothetical protein
LQYVSFIIFLIKRDFLIYDFCYGNFGQIIIQKLKTKHPILTSYFPLFAFADEISQLSSLGPEQTVLAPSDRGQPQYFRDLPQNMLIHPRFPGFDSNVLYFPAGLPFTCSMFVFRFDLISSKHRVFNNPTELNQEYTLFEYETISLTENFKVEVRALFVLSSSDSEVFNGKITYTLIINSKEINSISLEINDPNNTGKKTRYLNYAQTRPPLLNERLLKLGFYQVISPLTIMLRVITDL